MSNGKFLLDRDQTFSAAFLPVTELFDCHEFVTPEVGRRKGSLVLALA
jgi:hypothetical protein